MERKHAVAFALVVVAVTMSLAANPLAHAADTLVRVNFADPAGPKTIEGKLVVEAADGGVLLLARDGRLVTVGHAKSPHVEKLDRPFTGFNSSELARALCDELGPDFEAVQTRHYVIAARGSREYAQWCGDLFERLLAAFLDHWRAAGLALEEPKWPLPAIIFSNEADFKEYATADAGAFAGDSKGYYSIPSNRIVLYDLTAGKGKKRATTASEIKRRAAAASFNMATVVHEATHQIAFNSGMHTRLADNPLWLTEGMAMYFETPDLDGTQGWKTIGEINRPRLARFLDFVRKRRKRNSLETLVSGTDRFIDAHKATDAYAESWALTYFLNERHREQYVAYLKQLAKKQPMIWDEPEARLAQFQSVFGSDLKALDTEFLRFVKALPRK
ncbi:MAG TPA: DUF1570 domain-containing protein [Planctomycetaceae bacterium]|jgi:hypothetical protein|nr:DUF1570 domain-containing protein [Planctomycetaceae bacterium]